MTFAAMLCLHDLARPSAAPADEAVARDTTIRAPIDRFAGDLASPEATCRRNAVDALLVLGVSGGDAAALRVLEVLLPSLKDSDEDVRDSVMRVLQTLGQDPSRVGPSPEWTKALLEALPGLTAEARIGAVGLATFSFSDRSAWRDLGLVLLRDPDARVRREAARHVAGFGFWSLGDPGYRSLADALRPQLDSPAAATQLEAATCLWPLAAAASDRAALAATQRRVQDLLRNPEVSIRRAAAEIVDRGPAGANTAAGALPDELKASLLAALRDSDTRVVLHAAGGLQSACWPPRDEPAEQATQAALLGLLAQAEPEVRRDAAEKLRQSVPPSGGNDVATTALRKALDDPEPKVRLQAALLLASFTAGEPQAGLEEAIGKVLLETLRSPQMQERLAALRTAGQMVWRLPSAPTRDSIASRLREMLQEPDARVRRQALALATRWAPAPSPSANAAWQATLIGLLKDPDAGVRTAAAASLARPRGPTDDALAVPNLVAQLAAMTSDEFPQVAYAAHATLVRMAMSPFGETDANQAKNTVLERLKSPDAAVRARAAFALRRTPLPGLGGSLWGDGYGYGPNSKAFLPALLEALRDPSPQVRRNAAAVFDGSFPLYPPDNDTAAVGPALSALLRDGSVEVRAEAARALSLSGQRSPPGATAAGGVEALIQAVRDPDARVRRHAVSALVRVLPGGDGGAAAASAGMEAIVGALKDENLDVRLATASGLTTLARTPGDPASRQSVARILQKWLADGTLAEKQAAAMALAEWVSATSDAALSREPVTALVAATRDREPFARSAAYNALWRIGLRSELGEVRAPCLKTVLLAFKDEQATVSAALVTEIGFATGKPGQSQGMATFDDAIRAEFLAALSGMLTAEPLYLRVNAARAVALLASGETGATAAARALDVFVDTLQSSTLANDAATTLTWWAFRGDNDPNSRLARERYFKLFREGALEVQRALLNTISSVLYELKDPKVLPPLAEVLLTLLPSDDARLSEPAANALPELASRLQDAAARKSVTDRLMAMVAAEDAKARLRATTCLWNIQMRRSGATRAAEANALLELALQTAADPDPAVRAAAFGMIGALASNAGGTTSAANKRKVAQVLVTGLEDTELRARTGALNGLQSVAYMLRDDKVIRAAVPSLLKLAAETDENTCRMALGLLGTVAGQLHDVEVAASALKAIEARLARETHPGPRAGWLQQMGDLQLAAERFDDAIKSYRQALELAPQNPQFLRQKLSQALTRAGRNEEAGAVAEMHYALP